MHLEPLPLSSAQLAIMQFGSMLQGLNQINSPYSKTAALLSEPLMAVRQEHNQTLDGSLLQLRKGIF